MAPTTTTIKYTLYPLLWILDLGLNDTRPDTIDSVLLVFIIFRKVLHMYNLVVWTSFNSPKMKPIMLYTISMLLIFLFDIFINIDIYIYDVLSDVKVSILLLQ